MREVYVVGASRTPIGSFMGELSSIPAPKLGAIAIKAALEQATVPADAVGEVYLGCVLTAGVGQAPARQAALGAGLPKSVPCTTVNKVCGSGLKSVVLGAQSIQAGDAEVVVSGGMENMSLAPYILTKAREGFRMGHQQVTDSMVADGLWDVYRQIHMGQCAEICAREHKISREAQDAFAAESYRRALAAQKDGRFKAEMAAVAIEQRKGPAKVISEDEEPKRGNIEKLPTLKPAFDKDGTITAGNASSINDGGAAVVLMDADAARKRGLKPLARAVSWGYFAQDPEWFTTAPAGAINNALGRAGWKANEVDLWEINEAFSVVSLVNNQLLGLDPAKVNVNGGAVALGHPIGASGGRVLVTLLHAMAARGARRGGAALCIGGGEAICLLVERM
ncbi:MAG: acetyl-CoA C-acetyltransferase [Pseudomonadota bacterium]